MLGLAEFVDFLERFEWSGAWPIAGPSFPDRPACRVDQRPAWLVHDGLRPATETSGSGDRPRDARPQWKGRE
jgi:hypothetical protein